MWTVLCGDGSGAGQRLHTLPLSATKRIYTMCVCERERGRGREKDNSNDMAPLQPVKAIKVWFMWPCPLMTSPVSHQ